MKLEQLLRGAFDHARALVGVILVCVPFVTAVAEGLQIISSANLGNLGNHLYGVSAVAIDDAWAVGDYNVETFGSDVPLARAGQPEEIAPSYMFLASDDSSYMTGQILHPNGRHPCE